MLDASEAKSIIDRVFPDANVAGPAESQGRFIFRVIFEDDPLEGDIDPFWSIDAETGNLSEFTVMGEPDIKNISDQFVALEGG